MSQLELYSNGIPNISGSEQLIETTLSQRPDNVYLKDSDVDVGRIRSACAIALHMHQPLIPAGGDDLRTAAVIGNLQYMMEHQDIGDNHNAPAFLWCYRRCWRLLSSPSFCRTAFSICFPQRWHCLLWGWSCAMSPFRRDSGYN